LRREGRAAPAGAEGRWSEAAALPLAAAGSAVALSRGADFRGIPGLRGFGVLMSGLTMGIRGELDERLPPGR
jgi:hypothetical protein